LIGPVRRIRTEVAKLTNTGGGLQEGKHAILEIAAYDIKGNKIEKQYFPITGATLTGKEVYKYDQKGNISEMSLLNADGSLLSKETYSYEFDFAGNWCRMITSVAVVDGGRLTFEPTEVTYRSIMYYLDEQMLKSFQPVAVKSVSTQPAVAQPAVTPPVINTASEPMAQVEFKSVDTGPSQKVQMVALDAEPPPPVPEALLKPVSGGVLSGTAISLPPPLYPEAAKLMRTFGVVSVDVVLDETGKVISATATSGPVSLRGAAVQAALKARFSPTKLSGQPIKVSGVIKYIFDLAH
jgi:TonB family protein